jgi:hypothetical protein
MSERSVLYKNQVINKLPSSIKSLNHNTEVFKPASKDISQFTPFVQNNLL